MINNANNDNDFATLTNNDYDLRNSDDSADLTYDNLQQSPGSFPANREANSDSKICVSMAPAFLTKDVDFIIKATSTSAKFIGMKKLRITVEINGV